MKIATISVRCAALAILGLTFGNAAVAAGELPTVPVTKDFSEMDVKWDGGFGKGYVGRMKILASNGMLIVCGAGAYVNVSNRSQSKTVLKRAKLTMNGQTILKDFTYFTEVASEDAVIGAPAKCKATSASVPKGDAKFGVDYGVRAVRF